MSLKEEINDEASLAEKLRNEIIELNDVFYNWSYYDAEGLFLSIREKQVALRTLEENMRRRQYSSL